MKTVPIHSLESTFSELANVRWQGNEVDQGRDCLAYSENEDKVHVAFADRVRELNESAEALGMQVELEIDPFGNSYAVLAGESEREVMICSHLDSVPNGGKFDGVLGVTAGLETIQRFIDQDQKPNKTIRVAAFRAEESSITGHSCLGSALATGNFDISELKQKPYNDSGKSLFNVLTDRGMTESEIEQLRDNPYINAGLLDEVLEVHIEQSSVLESLDEPIGVVVNGIGGARRSDVTISSKTEEEVEAVDDNSKILKIIINGKAGHSGGLPMNGEVILDQEMNLRKDALVVAAQFLEVNPNVKLGGISIPDGGSYNVVSRECTLELLVPADFDYSGMRTQMDEILLDEMSADFQLLEGKKRVILINKDVVGATMKIIIECQQIAEEMARGTRGAVRATIGKLSVNTGNSIEIGIDQRRLNNIYARFMKERIKERIYFQSEYFDVNAGEGNIKSTSATPLSRDVADTMREAYGTLFGPKKPPEMGSMPGQDAAKVIRLKNGNVNGGMIFVRSLNGGVSHHPAELSSMDDIQKACDLLFATINR